jgi:hypothetical protein
MLVPTTFPPADSGARTLALAAALSPGRAPGRRAVLADQDGHPSPSRRKKSPS